MKINFKKPKFILPLIILPFIIILFFVFKGNGKAGKDDLAKQDSTLLYKGNGINPNMPGVSNAVENDSLKDKFEAYEDAYKKTNDESALQGLDIQQQPDNNAFAIQTPGTAANAKAKKTLDSLNAILHAGQQGLDQQMQRINEKGWAPPEQSSPRSKQTGPDELMAQLRRMQQEENQPAQSGIDNYNNEMKIFRDQLHIMDSVQKANGGNNKTVDKQSAKRGRYYTGIEDSQLPNVPLDNSELPRHVTRAGMQKHGSFNTVRHFSDNNENISAMIDQDMKVYLGSRVRIRLLEDIVIADDVIQKGSYIYGVVSGFQTQRVNITIGQIQYNNNPLPVKLDVYDNDGYLGLYVPGSNFREFTKELGTQGTQGLSTVTSTDNSSVSGAIVGSLFSSTTTTLSKLIKQDKANLKYDYIVYLKEQKN